MAAAERLTENYLTCTICSEVYADPATLHCDHTFCRPCLLKYIKTQPKAIQAKSIPCPSCRKITRVPSPDTPVEDWVNQVKPTRLIQALVEDFGPGTEIEYTRLCDMCKNEGEVTSATSWCPKCEESLCDSCVRMHRRVSLTREHQVTSLTGDFKPKQKRRFMCTEHKDEQVKLFCQDCDMAICHTCCSISHRQCEEVVTIESMMSEVSSKLQSRKEVTCTMIKERSQRLSEQKNQMEDFFKRTADVVAEVKNASQGVVDMIRKKERKLLEDINQLKDKQVEESKAHIKSEEITIQGYQQQFRFIDQTIKSECQKDMFAMYESCGDSEDDSDKDLDDRPALDDRPTPYFVGSIRFIHDLDRLSKAVDDLQLGEVEVVKDGSDRKSSAVLHRTIDCRMKGDETYPNLRDVKVLKVPGGKITVVADYSNKKVKLFYDLKSKGLAYKKSLKLPGGIWQLAHVKDNDIAMSLGNENQTLIVKCATSNPVITSTIQTKQKYFGLAYISPSQFLGGTYDQTNSIDIFNLSGKVLTSFSTDVVGNPDYIHVTKKKNVIVSETSSKSVVSVNCDGEVIFTYNCTRNGVLGCPWGITTTSSGDILVTEYLLNQVIQLTESGHFVRKVITDGLDSPRGLCLDDDGLLYVTSGKCVKVYRFK